MLMLLLRTISIGSDQCKPYIWPIEQNSDISTLLTPPVLGPPPTVSTPRRPRPHTKECATPLSLSQCPLYILYYMKICSLVVKVNLFSFKCVEYFQEFSKKQKNSLAQLWLLFIIQLLQYILGRLTLSPLSSHESVPYPLGSPANFRKSIKVNQICINQCFQLVVDYYILKQ